jgi:hypothetical protein
MFDTEQNLNIVPWRTQVIALIGLLVHSIKFAVGDQSAQSI